MPLRDHFGTDGKDWTTIHGGLPMIVATQLNARLPARYRAGLNIRIGGGREIDIGTFELDAFEGDTGFPDSSGGTALATMTKAKATYVPESTWDDTLDWMETDDFEVLIYDRNGERELVAAIEIISPSNKDRVEQRRLFTSKCSTLLKYGVSVSMVDFVTDHPANLYGCWLDEWGKIDKNLADPRSPIYAVTLRERYRRGRKRIESWYWPLAIGEPLPTLPIWLTESQAVPLELEEAYEQTLKDLRLA